jgi:hypothetical protein
VPQRVDARQPITCFSASTPSDRFEVSKTAAAARRAPCGVKAPLSAYRWAQVAWRFQRVGSDSLARRTVVIAQPALTGNADPTGCGKTCSPARTSCAAASQVGDGSPTSFVHAGSIRETARPGTSRPGVPHPKRQGIIPEIRRAWRHTSPTLGTVSTRPMLPAGRRGRGQSQNVRREAGSRRSLPIFRNIGALWDLSARSFVRQLPTLINCQWAMDFSKCYVEREQPGLSGSRAMLGLLAVK